MHRSGTSALTRVLSLLGCALPQTLIPGQENSNPTGFWESQAIVDVNKALLESAGSVWNDWRPLSPDWLSSPVREGFVDQAHEVLESEFGKSRFFALKDPRLCRLMPVWAEALELFGARPVYVLPVRNPLEVGASLLKRDHLVEGDGQLTWLRHMLDAEQYSRGQPRVFVRYDELLSNWRKVVDRISDKLEMPWPNRTFSAEDEIDAFLTPDLRHQSVEDSRVFEGTRLSPWIRQCYDVLCRWAHDEVRDGDVETLDRISAEMDAAVPAFERIVAETRSLGKKCRELTRRLEVGDATALEQRKALEAARAERDQRKANLGTAQAELTQLRADLAERDQRLVAADAAAREQGEALAAAQAELVRRQTGLDEATGELEKLRADLAERDQRLVAADAAAREQGEALAAAQAELARRQAGLEEATGELEKLRAEVMERDERLRNLEERHAAEREEARMAMHHASLEASNQLAEYEARVSTSSREIALLSKGLLAKKDENKRLLDRIADQDQAHEAEVAGLREQLLAAEGRVKQLQVENRQAMECLALEIEEWKKANEMLVQQIDDLKQSTSWRITAPARGLSTAVRSLVKRPARKKPLLLGKDRR